jgi:acetyl-CoA carboxylase biotin carboxyl carrier protein
MTAPQTDLVSQLSEWLAGTDIGLLELSGPGKTILLRRNGATVETETRTQGAPSVASMSTVVRAGSVGVVLHAHPLRTEPLVRVGEDVVAGQTVALLKIGLILLSVQAPRAGTVTRIAASHEAAVGYGDPLLEIE